MPTLVVGDHPEAGAQVADLVVPEREREGPAVHQHQRRRSVRAEHLDVQPGPVAGADGSCPPTQRAGQLQPFGVGVDSPEVKPALPLPGAGGERGGAGGAGEADDRVHALTPRARAPLPSTDEG